MTLPGLEKLKEQAKNDVWSLEDAEVVILNCPDNTTARIELARDIFSHNSFDSFEMDVLRALVKKELGFNKGSMASFANASAEKEEEQTHYDIAQRFIKDTFVNDGETVGAEGDVWRYNDESGLFEASKLPKIESAIGRDYPGKNNKKQGDYISIARLVYNGVENHSFFADAPYGVAVKSGFIRVSENGLQKAEPYSPELRQRFKMEADPVSKPAPLLEKYLADTFAGDECENNKALLQEIFGGLLTGGFSKIQKAVLLIGTGSNGKSVILDILYQLFHEGFRSAVSPERFGDPCYLADLAGKVVNIVGELDRGRNLKAVFKDVVGCDTPITARLPYRDPFSFKPSAGHIFASNHYPQTNDHTHGFYRRWVVLRFSNTVKESNKVFGLGERIVREELPQVLHWALVGAERLAQNGWRLSLSAKHKAEIDQWKTMKDSVAGFFADDDVVEIIPDFDTPSQIVYDRYREWCLDTGVRPLGRNNFLEAAELKFNRVKQRSGRRCLRGLRLAGRISTV